MLIQNKDDIQFVTEFPCFLGHPVFNKFIVKYDTNILQRRFILFEFIVNK